MSEPRWIKTEDELPPITESFADGTNFHAEVVGWFPQFFKHHDRSTCCWTSDSTEPRWMANAGGAYGHVRPGPTHWRHKPSAPE